MPGDVVRKLCVEGEKLGIKCRETGLKVIVVTTIRETFNLVCRSITEEGKGGVKVFT